MSEYFQPIEHVTEIPIRITGFEFSLANLFPPITVPVRIRFGDSRKPTRRKLRLCARTGHPASRLNRELSSMARESVVEDADGIALTMTPVHGKISIGRWCQRCGASLTGGDCE